MSVTLTVPSAPGGEPQKQDLPSVLSYFAQRRAAGYIGLLLPPVVLIYDRLLTLGCVPGSISASYHTGVRNFFIGSLCSVGVFLISSIGFKEDRPWSILAGVLAFLVGFFPTSMDDSCRLGNATEPPAFTPVVHLIAGVALFLVFALFCLVLFIRTEKDGAVVRRPKLATLPKPKRNRNIVFLVCGWIMVTVIATSGIWVGVAKLFNKITVPDHLVFVVEWVCLWSFGFAWLVKGQQLFKDEVDVSPKPETQLEAKLESVR